MKMNEFSSIVLFSRGIQNNLYTIVVNIIR